MSNLKMTDFHTYVSQKKMRRTGGVTDKSEISVMTVAGVSVEPEPDKSKVSD